MDIDSIEHRSRNPFLVAGYGLMGASAGFEAILKIAAGAGIHVNGLFFDGYWAQH
jgi:hypothetical protein